MLKIVLRFALILYCANLSAQLDLDLSQSESICSSDGSISAQATGGSEPYQYRLISGPELRGFQTSGTFLALQPGTYSVEVRDAAFDTHSENITVLGSYVLPNLDLALTLPTCSSSSDGQVVLTGSDGNFIGTAAFPTYKYRIVDLSTTPQTVIQEQNTDTFSGLSEGRYTFQIEDGCQNIASETVTLTAPSIVALDSAIDFIEKVACDTYEVEYSPFGRGVSPHQVTVTDDATGTVVFSDSIDTSSGLSYSLGSSYNFELGYTVDVIDACGQTETKNFSITPDLQIGRIKDDACSGDTTFFVYPSRTASTAIETIVLLPATLTLTNQANPSDQLVYNITDPGFLRVAIPQDDVTLGATYDLVLEDDCKYLITDTYTFIPVPATQFNAYVRPERGCMDGTTGMSFVVADGKTDFIRTTITSGPASFTSENGTVTNYSYPRIFEQGNNSVFPVGFPPGAYTAEITDGCDTGIVNFNILPSETVEHDFTLDFVLQCGNSNSLIINPNVIKTAGTSFYTRVRIDNLDTGDNVFRESLFFFTEGVPVTVPNLPAGNYQLNLEFQSGGECTSTNTFTCPCEPQTRNVTIPEYSSTSFDSIFGYTCTEGSGVIFAEGADGVAPYQYEIIASSIPSNIGRTSNDGTFTATDEGTYTVRITDSCGNSADGAFEVTPYIPDLMATCDASGSRVTLMANPVPDATFTWIDSGGVIVQQDTSNELVFDPFDPSQGGEYTLQISAPGLSCTVFDGAITVPTIPCNASIDVSKTVDSGPTYALSSDEYTVVYRITADNTGGLAGSYDVTDTFILGTGFTLNTATLAYGGESDGTDGTILSSFTSGDQIIVGESLAGLRTESWLVTANFTVDRDAIDPTEDCTNGGGFGNQITVTGDTDTSNNTACVPIAIGNITITKDGLYVDSDSNGTTNPGDAVNYTFVVTNAGNVSISNVVVSDPLLGGTITGPASGDTDGDGELDVAETWTYTASYSITQTDIDNGQVNNLATVTGQDPDGDTVSDTSTDPTPCGICTPDPTCTDCTLTELPTVSGITITKDGLYVDSDSNGTTNPGDAVNYTFVVTNAGNLSISNVVVSDPLLGGTIAGPASGDTDGDGELDVTETWTYTASYNITQTDIENGQVNNLATVTGQDPDGTTVTATSTDPTPCASCTPDPTCSDCTLTELPNTLDIGLTKTVDLNTAEIGEEIVFTISATNNGTITASNITISETLPNGFQYVSHTTTLGTYSETNGQWNIAILNSGQIAELQINVIVVEGTNYLNIARLVDVDQTDTDPSNDEASVEVGIRGINITKDGVYTDSNVDEITNVGDMVDYTFTITNTGNLSLTNVLVSDPLLGGIISGPDSGDTSGDNILDVTEVWLYSASYAITQIDIDNGQVNNLATVRGEDPQGRTVTDTSTDPTPCTTCTVDPNCADCTLTELANSLDIGLTKIVDATSAMVGDEVNFTITAINNGSIRASTIVIAEMLPNGFEYIEHETTLGAYDSSTGLWNIATLGAGGVAALTIRALVVDGTDYLNVASLIDVDQVDTDSSNDEDSVDLIIDEPICEIFVYNSFSPNGDGTNEVFYIECIENYPNNMIEIFNRWGIKVFEQNQYNNTWDGISYGRTTYDQEGTLPVGTYFYVLDLGDGTKTRTGWVYITR